ncbi:MAG TPA: hypothetical protein DCL15_10365 [Chloroflexi bacterium]|nr:hypothetical protein [Chloroflexota bacterium]HHW88986.1 glycosyltransferase family 2 protein [Chloroflexota bacterium]
MSHPSQTLQFSVLIATYNRAESLCHAVQSVLSQPGDYFEVIVGDDASPDHTQDAIKPFLADSRVRYYRNEFNLGMCDNYLKIFGEARGDYIFVLTDDDWLLDGGLERIRGIIQQHPQVGYILSDLPTVDARTGKVVSLDRVFSTDRLLEPGLKTLEDLAGAAWVLSRQVIRRDLVDWQTWRKFKDNIFFPIIYSGRAMLKDASYYLADAVVMHTWFNKVFWHKFGKDDLDINFNLARDRHLAMSAILYDYSGSPEAERLIRRWELRTLKLYLNSESYGFYDLVRYYGLRAALAKVQKDFRISPGGYLAIAQFFLLLPLHRAWVNAKSLGRRHAPNRFEQLKALKNRWVSSSKTR